MRKIYVLNPPKELLVIMALTVMVIPSAFGNDGKGSSHRVLPMRTKRYSSRYTFQGTSTLNGGAAEDQKNVIVPNSDQTKRGFFLNPFKRTGQQMTRDQIAALTTQYLAKFDRLDIDGLIDGISDNAVLRFPYSTGLTPDSIRGAGAIREHLSQVYQNFESATFSPKNIIIDVDTRTVVVTMEGKIQLKSGGEYINTYVHVVKFTADGKISELSEYFNPYNVAKAFGLLEALSQ